MNIFKELGVPDPEDEVMKNQIDTNRKACYVCQQTLPDVAKVLATFYVALAQTGFNAEQCMEICKAWLQVKVMQ